MPRIHLTVCCLARNEAGRFLPSALRAWTSFADSIVLVDDHSTDNTAELAKDHGAIVVSTQDDRCAWGNESGYRQLLWGLALENTPDDGWLFFLDADMTPASDPRELLQSTADAWAFPLYDIWDERQGKLYYREDNFWCGHLHPRIWLVRKPTTNDWTWNERGIHCGHMPTNYRLERGMGIAPYDMSLLHFAYSDAGLRRAKAIQYASTERIMTAFERRHAESITDPSPRLLPLPFTPQYTLKREIAEVQNVA